MRTALLIPPSLGEIKAQASQYNPPLPEDECELFHCHYESNGWKVGKVPMKSWLSALRGWWIRWKQKQQNQPTVNRQYGQPVFVGPSIASRELAKMAAQAQKGLL